MPKVLILAAVAAAALFAPKPSFAAEYPWCAINLNSDTSNCGYVTREQCLMGMSGNGGVCQANPRFSGATAGYGMQEQPQPQQAPRAAQSKKR